MLMFEGGNFERECDVLISLTANELVQKFGKTIQQAKELIDETKVRDSLLENPLGLHDSPYRWAVAILTKCKDIEALEECYLN